MRALLAALALLPAAAPAEPRWVTWDSPAWGWIGTNPHDRNFLLYEDQDGTLMPVIWEAENASPADLAGCAFVADAARGSARGEACPAELVVDLLEDGDRLVLIVRRLVALGRPGQPASFE